MIKMLSDQSDWDELLGYISEKNLTPVIGKEMYKFQQDDKLIPIDEHLSKQLLELNKVTDQPSLTLPEAVNYLENEMRIKPLDIKNKLKIIVKNIDKDFPGLTEFLSISDLNYYINIAVYNNVLEDNLTKIKKKTANSINFSINQPFTDSEDLEKLNEPFVFNVFGSLLNTVDPALSEEDMLEYTGSFKEKMNIAPNLINALKNKNLLFLGCAFPDWMVRFILRLLSNEPLHDWGSNRKIFVVNDQTDLRQRQYNFLKNYEVVTYEGNTIDFVKELTTRWKQKPQEGKSKMIFLSYSRKDKDAVEALKKSLESIDNVSCWYDKQDLEGGDIYNTDIILNIRKADLFIPLISANSLANKEGYVYKEWSSAEFQNIYRKNDGANEKFLIPVVIDNSDLSDPNIPSYFSELSIEPVPNGNPDPKFINNIKETLKLI
ncbi:MAG: toll/interleukin-1 receptor domain-containing protein [Ignavibacteriaceae bacterium]